MPYAAHQSSAVACLGRIMARLRGLKRPVPQLIACDLDGTLLPDWGSIGTHADGNAKQVSDRAIAAIKRYRALGGHFLICTGRGYDMLEPVANEVGVDSYSIGCDGGEVYGKLGQIVKAIPQSTWRLTFVKAVVEAVLNELPEVDIW